MLETLFILFIIFGLIWISMQKPSNFPPGPICLPLLGNLHNVGFYNVQKGWEFLRQKYGNIIGLVVPRFKIVVVNGWRSITEVLANADFQGRPDVCSLRDRFNGELYGLAFMEGEGWKVQRRFVLHHFRNLGFGRKTHESVILEEAQSLADEIDSLVGTPVVMQHLFGISMVNIIWHIIGGQRYDRKDPILLKLVEDVKKSMHHVQVVGNLAAIIPFIRYLFPKTMGYKSIKNGCKGILQFIKGYSIPKGTILIINAKSVFMDPEYWGDPENFRPERFIKEDGQIRKDEPMIYFGKGKRSCLGETVARMSSFLIFVSLVQRFSFRFPEGDVPQNTQGIPRLTMSPPKFRVIASPRNKNGPLARETF